MSSDRLVAYTPLVMGSTLIALAILPMTPLRSQAFFLEWAGAFLAFVGLSYLMGRRMALPLALVVLVGGSLGDLVLLGGLTPVGWAVVNYMVFIHSCLGSLLGDSLKKR